MSLKNPINIPLRIDATFCGTTTQNSSVVPPTTDYSRLQNTIISNGGTAANTSPWLGDTSISETESYTLPQGMHLHWTLPKALRSGATIYKLTYQVYNELIQQGVPWPLVQLLQNAAGIDNEYTLKELTAVLNALVPTSPAPWGIPTLDTKQYSITGINSDDPKITVKSYIPKFAWDPILLEIFGPLIVKAAAEIKMPPVPNRWLIVRYNSKTSSYDNSWVIESDRLSPPSAIDPLGTVKNSAVINTFTDSQAQQGVGEQTGVNFNLYQYLGANFQASTWNEDRSANRLTPLTCLGNGAPEFASSYINCAGVFGFYDSSVVDDSANYTYTVVGWFSDPVNDPASASYNVTPWSAKNTTLSEILTALKWNLDSTDLSHIDGSIYTATINVTGSNCEINAGSLPQLSDANVSIGNTSVEALSAYICQSPSPQPAGDLGLSAETLLNATQAGLAQKTLEPDGTALIENALHQERFSSEQHGWLWEIKPLPKDQQPAKPHSLPGSTATDLSALNECQLQFDRTQDCIVSERKNLFTDWCRALHLETDASNNYGSLPTDNEQVNVSILANALLSQASLALDAAGMGDNSSSEYLLAYQAACDLYNAIKKVQTDLINSGHYLKRIPAPRHYRCADPHILMSDTLGSASALVVSPASSLKYDPNNFLKCSVVLSTPAPAIPTACSFLSSPSWSGPGANVIFNYISNAPPVQTVKSSSWRPLCLQWQISFYPCTKGLGTLNSEATPPSFQPYSSTYISDNCTLDANGIEYVTSQTLKDFNASTPCNYKGRVLLSSLSIETMQKQILQLCGMTTPPKNAQSLTLPGLLNSGNAATLIQSAYSQNANTLSQTLDGFTERLRMLRKISQVSVFDPNGGLPNGLNNVDPKNQGNANNALWDTCSQSNYLEVGKQHALSPEQTDIYNPIRAGLCELPSIRLIDAFGQTSTWTLTSSNLFISNTLQNLTSTIVESPAPAFFLPPRLAQHSRILFRWITANQKCESNNLSESSPVCGWIALNRIDNLILFFNADGSIYGSVDQDGTFKQIASGTPVVNAFLLAVKNTISGNASQAQQFYSDIDNTLLSIEPFSHRHASARSVLISRPLAITQASLNLELLGTPSGHQGYEWLESLNPNNDTLLVETDDYCPVTDTKMISPFIKRETCGFTDVQVPVYLGDVSMSNDGLLLYWNISSTTSGSNLPAYTLVSNESGASKPVNLTCNPDPKKNPDSTVLMLHDPRAPIHLTSALLPVKQITIPPHFYSEAIRSMEYQMSVAPLITPFDADNHVTLPIPQEVTGTWSWVSSSGVSQSVVQSDDKLHLQTTPPSIQNGTLQFKQIQGSKS